MLIKTENLKKHFNITRRQTLRAVDGVSLTIRENEILGLVGESGSGKSTFGKTLVGLHEKTAGKIFYNGEQLPDRFSAQDHLSYSEKMQMIFQDPYSSLNPRMTVLDIVGEGLRIHKQHSESEVQEKVAFWLKRVGLSTNFMSRYPHEFSGGQRQRIGIARAMIIEPRFIVCDEPISALDVSVKAQIINLISELKQSMSLTLLFITHDLSIVRYISDRIAVMYLGLLAEVGPANDLFFEPRHPYTELLVESSPDPEPQLERSSVLKPTISDIPALMDKKSGCPFANRCPRVMNICQVETPELIQLSDDRQVACHLFS